MARTQRRRVQTQSGLDPERLQPRASPVETLTQPAPTRGQRALRGLAEGLSEISPSLMRLAQQEQDIQSEEDRLEGQEAAQRLIEEGATYRQAVADGLIRRDQSPMFRLGAKRQFATVSAQQYEEHLVEQATQWADEGDPSTFRAREQALRREWVAENLGDARDAGFDSFFADAANQAAANVGRGFAARAGERAVEMSIDMVATETVGAVRRLSETPDQLVEYLQTLSTESVQIQGLPGAETSDAIARGLIQAAVDSRDFDLLGIEVDPDTGEFTFTGEGILHQVRAGTGPIGDLPRVMEQMRDAAFQISAQRRNEWAAAADADRAAGDVIQRGLGQAFAEAREEGRDPFRIDMEPFASDAERRGLFELANKIRQVPEAARMAQITSNPLHVENLSRMVLLGEAGFGTISDELAAQSITSDDAVRLISLIGHRANVVGREGSAPDFLDHRSYKRTSRQIQNVSRVFDDDYVFNLGDTEHQNLIRLENAAQRELESKVLEYLATDGRDADEATIAAEIEALGEQVLNTYFPMGLDDDARTQHQQQLLNRNPAFNPARDQIIPESLMPDLHQAAMEVMMGGDPEIPRELGMILRRYNLNAWDIPTLSRAQMHAYGRTPVKTEPLQVSYREDEEEEEPTQETEPLVDDRIRGEALEAALDTLMQRGGPVHETRASQGTEPEGSSRQRTRMARRLVRADEEMEERLRNLEVARRLNPDSERVARQTAQIEALQQEIEDLYEALK